MGGFHIAQLTVAPFRTLYGGIQNIIQNQIFSSGRQHQEGDSQV